MYCVVMPLVGLNRLYGVVSVETPPFLLAVGGFYTPAPALRKLLKFNKVDNPKNLKKQETYYGRRVLRGRVRGRQ